MVEPTSRQGSQRTDRPSSQRDLQGSSSRRPHDEGIGILDEEE